MTFTGLHRALGANPGRIRSEMVDRAVAAGVMEADDLDWKSELPPERGLNQTDFPKDVAAMADAGGGVIVYGVDEVAKAATGRLDVGEFSEQHERALRSAAVTAISPPVFGLDVLTFGDDGSRVVAVSYLQVWMSRTSSTEVSTSVRRFATTLTRCGCGNVKSKRCTAPVSSNNATRTKRFRPSTQAQRRAEIRGTGRGLLASLGPGFPQSSRSA